MALPHTTLSSLHRDLEYRPVPSKVFIGSWHCHARTVVPAPHAKRVSPGGGDQKKYTPSSNLSTVALPRNCPRTSPLPGSQPPKRVARTLSPRLSGGPPKTILAVPRSSLGLSPFSQTICPTLGVRPETIHHDAVCRGPWHCHAPAKAPLRCPYRKQPKRLARTISPPRVSILPR